MRPLQQLRMRRSSVVDLPVLPSMPAGMVIRTSREGDDSRLATLLRAAFVDDKWTPERVRCELTEASDVVKTLVVEHERDGIIATASALIPLDVNPRSGYLHWVAASPMYSGKRLGWVVSLAILYELFNAECVDAVLLTDNYRLPAIKTYLNLGFLPDCQDSDAEQRWKVILDQLRVKR